MTVGKHPPEEKSEKGDLLKCFHINCLKYIELVVFMIFKNQMKKAMSNNIKLASLNNIDWRLKRKKSSIPKMYIHLTQHNLEYN